MQEAHLHGGAQGAVVGGVLFEGLVGALVPPCGEDDAVADRAGAGEEGGWEAVVCGFEVADREAAG